MPVQSFLTGWKNAARRVRGARQLDERWLVDAMKRIALWMLAFGGSALPTGLGCTSQTTAAAPAPDAGAVEEEGDASDGSTTKSSGKDACEKLIACVADISPSQAGGYVNLYGDASNCWKGSAGDAEACGKACEEELDKRPECQAIESNEDPIEGTYLAGCGDATTGGSRIFVDAVLSYDKSKGGKATLGLLSADASTYRSNDVLMTFPAMALSAKSGGGAGEVTGPFEVPASALTSDDLAVTEITVQDVTVRRLRRTANDICSDLQMRYVLSPNNFLTYERVCIYLPLKQGAAIPNDLNSQLQRCK